MNSTAAASSSSSSRPPLSPHQPPHFSPIEEGNEDKEFSQGRRSFRASKSAAKMHNRTPLHRSSSESRGEGNSRKNLKNREVRGDDRGISCNKCRPSTREKISAGQVMDSNGVDRQFIRSPSGIFKSFFSSLVKKSPKSSVELTSVSGEWQWKIAAAELSRKLIQATKEREEAVLEVSRLKNSMAELEKKLNKLEIDCHNLKSGLEVCSNNSQKQTNEVPQVNYQLMKVGDQGKVIEHFLVSVSEARSTVKLLSRSLMLQLKQMGGKVYDRISLLLQPYDINISLSRNPKGFLLCIEALLNGAFFEDFESTGFQKSASVEILNPINRCEANFASFHRLQELRWDEVLKMGTKHFSEDFSKFCDRKMSEIVSMLGWDRAWPEQLLQSFFGASKAVWLVHLLAHSKHPSLPIFRVDKGASFDSVYMEDMGGDKAKTLVPTTVKLMVTPGFYVYDIHVVKCKVICWYRNNIGGSDDKVLASSPT